MVCHQIIIRRFINFIHRKNVMLIAGILALIIAFLPYFILGENATITIHDNLDSNLVAIKMLIENGMVFSAPLTEINQLFNGVPRVSLYGNFEFNLICFYFFGSYFGYAVSKFIVALIAFIGMYLLIKRHFLTSAPYFLIPFGVALIFALLPFWSFTMSAMGLPLLLYAFLNIRKDKSSWTNWLIIILMPFCSNLILSGFFFMIVMTLIFIHDLIKLRKINYSFLTGLITLGFFYILSHYMLFYSFLISSDYVSHRTEFGSYNDNFSQVLTKILEIFVFGHYHTEALHSFMMIPVAIGIFWVLKTKSVYKKWFVSMLLYIVLTSIYYGITYWEVYAPIQTKLTDILPIRLTRFIFLHPMFWYLLLAISLHYISKKIRFGKIIVAGVLMVQMIYVLKSHELVRLRNGPSYSDFYSTDQFKHIKAYIGKPPSEYRIISVGFHPSIALYNGFYSLDGYLNDYPLEYKRQFRKIIAKELEKDDFLKHYFDDFGIRCYAYSAELGRSYNIDYPNQQKSVDVIQHLDYDFKTFREMGGEYILSKKEINTSKNLEMKLLKVFEGKKTNDEIYLYTTINTI